MQRLSFFFVCLWQSHLWCAYIVVLGVVGCSSQGWPGALMVFVSGMLKLPSLACHHRLGCVLRARPVLRSAGSIIRQLLSEVCARLFNFWRVLLRSARVNVGRVMCRRTLEPCWSFVGSNISQDLESASCPKDDTEVSGRVHLIVLLFSPCAVFASPAAVTLQETGGTLFFRDKLRRFLVNGWQAFGGSNQKWIEGHVGDQDQESSSAKRRRCWSLWKGDLV